MSVVDRLDAAKHSLTGSVLAKTACKASSREVMGPKRKHVDYLIHCTNSDHISIPNLAEILFERCANSNWTVVFKALITFHHLMSYGSERVIQYLASRTTNWSSLANFMDKSGVQGYDMSTFVRRYSNYLNEKAVSYRTMAYDFCRLKRGKQDGVLRTMDSTKLLKALPVLQQQIDALLQVDIKATELTNGVINSAFVLLFKDLIRLFACYNDGIINLLEKYFDMNKKECKQALDIYKKFIVRMERVSDFLKVAEEVGFDKDDIPDLSKAPNSLLDALENHLQSLEKGKPATTTTTIPPTLPSITVPSVVSDAFKVSGGFATKFEESDKPEPDPVRSGLSEEEEKYLEAFKKAKETGTSPQLHFPTAQQQSGISPDAWKMAAAPTPSNQAQPQKPAVPSDDLLQLNAVFAAPVPQQSASAAFSSSSAFPPSQAFGAPQPAPSGFGSSPPGPWGGSSGASTQGFNPFDSSPPASENADFDAVFGGTSSVDPTLPIGDVLTPSVASGVSPDLVSQQPSKDDTDSGKSGDLQTKLQRVAKSLDAFSITNGAVSKNSSGKTQHQWTPAQPQVKTGGSNWQRVQPLQTTVPSVPVGGQVWGSAPGMMQQGMYRPPMGQPMAQPFMGQPGMYQQPVAPVGMGFGAQPFQPRPQQPQDPFGPIPGPQARF